MVKRSEFAEGFTRRKVAIARFVQDPEINQTLRGTGLSPQTLASAANLNGDHYLSTAPEMEELFRQLDNRFDTDGYSRSMATQTADGTPTVQGLLLARVEALAEPETPSQGASMCEAGRLSVLQTTRSFQQSLARTGVGDLAGDGSPFARMSDAQRRSFIRSHLREGMRATMPRLTSCVGFVMDHVQAAYEAVDLGARWQEIRARVLAQDADGTVLMQELEKDGWTAIYWNPDVRRPADGNDEHPSTYREVLRGLGYYGTHPREMIINYRPTEGSATVQDRSGLERLAQVPFWVAVTNGGYHCFTGLNATVYESHQARNPTDPTCVEHGPFERFGLFEQPSTLKYNSGVILIPPGMWPPG